MRERTRAGEGERDRKRERQLERVKAGGREQRGGKRQTDRQTESEVVGEEHLSRGG